MSNENHVPKVEIATPAKAQDEARRPRRPIVEVVPEEDGERLALESGVTEPLPEHLEIINRSSGALGDEEWERRWDPEHKPSDALLAQEHEANLQRRAEFEKQIRQRRAEHRESEDALAAVPAGGPKPLVHWLFQLVVTAIIAISIAPTLREDLFAPIEDNFWGWVAALSVGAALALTVVTVALWAHRKPNDLPPLMRRMGLFAGLLMVVGCVLLRLRSMESAGDALWALALMAIELAAVLFVEFQAANLEGALKEWETCKSVEDGKARLRDAALAELERQVALSDDVQRKLDEHIRDIADRQPRFASREETIAAITNRKLNGYHIGIAKNRGFLLGTVRRSR